MKKDEIKKYYIVIALLLIVVLVTVGYALLQTGLSINGTISTKSNSWNIYFDNIVLNQDSVSKTLPTISNKTSLNFNVELATPGDLYGFTVDAVNGGSIDAKIGTVSITSLTEEQDKLIDLSVTYDDENQIQEEDELNANTTKKIKVLVKYKDDINNSDLPNSNLSIPITIAIEYVQAEESSTDIDNPSGKTNRYEGYSPYIIDSNGTLTDLLYPPYYEKNQFESDCRKLGIPVESDYVTADPFNDLETYNKQYGEYEKAKTEYLKKIGEPVEEDYITVDSDDEQYASQYEAFLDACRKKGIPIYQDYVTTESYEDPELYEEQYDEFHKAYIKYQRKIGIPVPEDYVYDNYLELIELYNKATGIGHKDIVIPDDIGIKSINGERLPFSDNLESLTIPSNVTEIKNLSTRANVIYNGSADMTNNRISLLNGYFPIVNGFNYELNEENKTVKFLDYTWGTNTYPKKLIFKSKYMINGQEYTLTEFGEYAFWCQYTVEELVIPDSVVNLERGAFGNLGQEVDINRLKISIGSGVTRGYIEAVVLYKNLTNRSTINNDNIIIGVDYVKNGIVMKNNGLLVSIRNVTDENARKIIIPNETKYINYTAFVFNYGDEVTSFDYKGINYTSKSELKDALNKNGVRFVNGIQLEDVSEEDVDLYFFNSTEIGD